MSTSPGTLPILQAPNSPVHHLATCVLTHSHHLERDPNDIPQFPFARPRADQAPCEYAQLRGTEPVSRVRLWDGSTAWLVVRHGDVRSVLADGDGCGRWSKDRRRAGFPEVTPAGKDVAKDEPTFVYMDEPGRTKHRRIIDGLFSQERVESRSPGVVKKTIEMLFDSLVEQSGDKPVDFYDRFAMRVPNFIMFSILGAPAGDLEYLTEYNAAQLKPNSSPTEVASANKKLLEYISNMLEHNMAKPRNSVIGDLVVEQIKSGHISKSDALRLLYPMLVTATVTNLICYGLILLLQHPGQLEYLKADPSLARVFVEELCRFHTSSAITSPRVATADVILGGRLIRAGESVLLSNTSANRDEEVFPRSDEFNMHRRWATEDALAFGYGPRRCPVEWLAREQLETVFALLFQRLPDVKLAVPSSEIKWLPSRGVVGVSELPIYR